MNPYHGHHRPSRPKLRRFGLISVVLSVIFGVAAMAAPTASATDVESNPDFIFLAFCDGAMFQNTGDVDLVITANSTPYLRAAGEYTETVPYNDVNQVDYTVEFGEQVVGSGTVNKPAQCDAPNIVVTASVQFDCSEVPISGVINVSGKDDLDALNVRLGLGGPQVVVPEFANSANIDAATLAQVQSFTGWYWEIGSGDINGAFDPVLEYEDDCGPTTKTVTATSLDQECPDGGVEVLAHFVITSIGDDAPARITVDFSDDSSADVSLDKVTGGTAHYNADVPSGAMVSGASAVVPVGWDGQFNLSHYECEVPTTTVPPTTSPGTTVPPTTTPVTTTPVTTTPVTTTPVTTTPVTTTPVTTTPTTSATTVPFTPNSPLPSTGGDGSQDYSGPLWILSAVFGAMAFGGFLRRRFARVS